MQRYEGTRAKIPVAALTVLYIKKKHEPPTNKNCMENNCRVYNYKLSAFNGMLYLFKMSKTFNTCCKKFETECQKSLYCCVSL